jgi:ribonuclease BN (tRNA processing enzyme)
VTRQPPAATLPITPAGLGVRVLGASGGYPAAGSPCSGYLLEAAERRVWVDAGGGTLAELQRHCQVADLDAIWISHLHPDHCTDLPLVVWLLLLGGAGRAAPLPVLGPAGWAAKVAAFVDEPLAEIARVVEIIELADGHKVRVGGLEVTAIATAHGIPTFGLRASLAGHTLAYTADSGPCQALERLATDCDLLVCEAGTATPGPDAIHLTAGQAGQLAAGSGAGRLVLTHLRPDADPEQACSLAAASFGGHVEVATPGRRFELLPPAP